MYMWLQLGHFNQSAQSHIIIFFQAKESPSCSQALLWHAHFNKIRQSSSCWKIYSTFSWICSHGHKGWRWTGCRDPWPGSTGRGSIGGVWRGVHGAIQSPVTGQLGGKVRNGVCILPKVILKRCFYWHCMVTCNTLRKSLLIPPWPKLREDCTFWTILVCDDGMLTCFFFFFSLVLNTKMPWEKLRVFWIPLWMRLITIVTWTIGW